MRNFFAILALGVLCAGCVNPGGGRGPADIAVYDLGPPAASSPVSLAPSASDLSTLSLTVEVRLPAWLDGQTMLYRLPYADPQRLHQYALARWSTQPGNLLQQRLRQLLGSAGSAGVAGTACTVRIELDSFLQVFDSPETSRAEVRGTVFLMGRNRELWAQHAVQLDRATSSPDATGGVHALSAAANDLGSELARWLGRQNLAACRR